MKQVSSVVFDPDADLLVVWYTKTQPEAVAHYIDEHVALLCTNKRRVVGVQIEDFSAYLVKTHAIPNYQERTPKVVLGAPYWVLKPITEWDEGGSATLGADG